MAATLLFGSMTVNAAGVSMSSKQNADYMMSINKDGVPNWFNGTYYGNRYEDLKAAFNANEKALYNHCLQYGFNESRLVTPVLDVSKYRNVYPDLNKAFGDNWMLYVRHYFEYGINEGRENFTDFDAKSYLNMYTDLQNMFGADLGLATRHYIEFGLSEGRAYNWPESEKVYKETDSGNDDTNDVSYSDSSDNGSSDSGSSDNDTADESFTGDKREDFDDGSYVITTYVNGVLTSEKYYVADGEIATESTFDESGAIKTRTAYRADGTKLKYSEWNEQGCQHLFIEYQEDGITEEYKTIFAYDENGNMVSDRTTWEDGSSKISTYENGSIVSNRTTWEDGYTMEVTYENGIRAYQVDTHIDGTRVESEYYEDGVTQKKTTTFYTYGSKCVLEKWENDNLKSYTWYDADGNMTQQQLYDENGNLTSDTEYPTATASNATPEA